ncbi:hypothetical protein IEQ34_016428 [Dendrobium chrysotoxum]|uniref:Uncharacterized protein n=1 Tax=Dendrobium chrysotoxum TaxID=161865 RepID=A0AAV7GFR3_DENCH|nr:hypothetical protein IEQ34_016428 [Dendrobium chrysotoxum]
MDLPESNVPNMQHNTAPVLSDNVTYLATIITQGDEHLQTFYKLKPLLFKGVIGPQIVED